MAYNDLQEHLTQLESLEKLHTIEKTVDPTWEVAAITRHVFDRYSWANRPALRFNRVIDATRKHKSTGRRRIEAIYRFGDAAMERLWLQIINGVGERFLKVKSLA